MTDRRWWTIVAVLVSLELRQRLRTTRWRITLGIGFLLMSVVVFGSLYLTVGVGGADYRSWSENLFGLLIAVEMFLGLVLAPTLTATSINGDRKDATLAVVQVTPISNWQLAIGKLLGSWVSCLALVGVTAPYLIWAVVAAPYGIAIGVLGIAVMCLLFLSYCGVGLGFSALTARPAGSAVLTQASVFFLILGLPAVFGLLYPTVSQDHTVVSAEYTYPDSTTFEAPAFDALPDCRDVPFTRSFTHTEKIWWLLVPNPFLILPDVVAAHDNPNVYVWPAGQRPADPTIASAPAGALSEARMGPLISAPKCSDQQASYFADGSGRSEYYERQSAHNTARIGDSWYLGLAVNVVLGALGLMVAARRLRVPSGKLPRGVRIA